MDVQASMNFKAWFLTRTSFMCCFNRADANRVQADEYDPIMEKLKKDIRKLGGVEHVNHGDLVFPARWSSW